MCIQILALVSERLSLAGDGWYVVSPAGNTTNVQDFPAHQLVGHYQLVILLCTIYALIYQLMIRMGKY